MCVDVANRHRDPGRQPGPRRRLRGELPGGGTELTDRVGQLGVDEVGEAGIECGLEVAARVFAVLQDALVAGAAGVAHILGLAVDATRGAALVEGRQDLLHSQAGADGAGEPH
jgi:hypothetical protein